MNESTKTIVLLLLGLILGLSLGTQILIADIKHVIYDTCGKAK
jgi:hypothetical protein